MKISYFKCLKNLKLLKLWRETTVPGETTTKKKKVHELEPCSKREQHSEDERKVKKNAHLKFIYAGMVSDTDRRAL